MVKLDRTGEKYITNEGYEIEIIKYFGANNCTIKFNDEKSTILYNVAYKGIKISKIRNPNHPKTYGIGYMGIGKYLSEIDGKRSNYYTNWSNIFQRSYSENAQQIKPHYKGCSVDERWYSFQNFAEWMESNYNSKTMQGWQLDKDILQKGNKVYSPETCCFVPHEINLLYTKNKKRRGEYPIGVSKSNKKFQVIFTKRGTYYYLGTFDTIEEAFQVYKEAKEDYIKEVAEEWKDLIDPRVYEAMYEYQVEITD